MNGRAQTDALADLAKPALASLAGFKVGDFVRLPSIDCTLQVIAIADPLLILRAPSGRELKAGWRAVTKIRSRAEIEGRRHE